MSSSSRRREGRGRNREDIEDEAYSNVIRERLKFKGVGEVTPERSEERQVAMQLEEGGQDGVGGGGVTRTALATTAAEAELQAARDERERERLRKYGAAQSYRARVEVMNQKLAAESDHHDVPKISSAGIG